MAPSNSFWNQEACMCKPNIHKAFRKKKILQKLIKHFWKSDFCRKTATIYHFWGVYLLLFPMCTILTEVQNKRDSTTIFVPRKTEVNLWKWHLCFVITANQARKARIMMILLLIMLICILSVTNNLCNIVCVRRRRRRIWIGNFHCCRDLLA
jgi:hypothetical protein